MKCHTAKAREIDLIMRVQALHPLNGGYKLFVTELALQLGRDDFQIVFIFMEDENTFVLSNFH